MIEDVKKPNPKSRSERTKRRKRVLILSSKKEYPATVTSMSIFPSKAVLQMENQKNNNVVGNRSMGFIYFSLSLSLCLGKARVNIRKFEK